jgi:hypothetical protein
MYKKQMFELFQQKTAIWTGKKGSLDWELTPLKQIFFVLLR